MIEATVTNRDFLSAMARFILFVVDEKSARSYPRFSWVDTSLTLEEDAGTSDIMCGVCNINTRRGTVMSIDYYDDVWADDEKNCFVIKRHSDVGFTETIKVTFAQLCNLHKNYKRGLIEKDDALAMMRAASTLA